MLSDPKNLRSLPARGDIPFSIRDSTLICCFPFLLDWTFRLYLPVRGDILTVSNFVNFAALVSSCRKMFFLFRT